MTCDAIRPELKAFLDHELNPVAAWRVRRHLARCASCAAELDALRRLHAVLRAADPSPSEAAEGIPLRRPARWKWAGAALATAVLAVFLVILPTLRQSPRSMSAAVAAALSHVNTWHLHGWKQINGKQVAWDVWGRRWPYLFYEKIGSDITYDDGTQRLRIYPADPALNRPTGLVIRTDSDRGDFNGFGPSVEDMVSLWDWRQGAGEFAPKPYRETPTTVAFRLQYPAGVGYGVSANQLYTISRFTWLPERYELRFSTAAFQRDVEDLAADYDVDLPRAVTAPPIPAAFRRVNLADGHDLGLTVQASPIDMDPTGNVLVRVRDPLGSASAAPGSPFTLSASAADSHPFGVQGSGIVTYIPMDAHGYQYQAPNGNVLFWFVPLEPAAKASALPTALNLTVSVSINVQVQATDFIGPQGQPYSEHQPETLLTKDFPWTLPLPRKPTVKNIQASPAWHFQWGQTMWPLAYYEDQARAGEYYLDSFGWQADVFRKIARDRIRSGVLTPDGYSNPAKAVDVRWLIAAYKKYAPEFAAAQHQKRVRAVYWLKREIATLPTTGRGHWWRLVVAQQLALYEKVAGEKAQSQQTLRQLIHDCNALPLHGGLLRRQAEYALRTGQFPDDADYKGPS